MKKQKVIIIAGPTASGKSGLALNLAEKIKGEIVNADAFQVYQGLQILTARPKESEMRGIPHHLYGYMDNWHQENVQEWAQKAASLIPEIKTPIVVGGTGLYISGFVNGMSPIPEVSIEIRKKVRDMSDKEVLAKLPKGRIPKDIQRQKRALEVFLETGHSIEYFQNLPKEKFLDADFKTFVLLPPREKIYTQIEVRLNQMLKENVVGEVQNLLMSSPTGGVIKAIGVKELIDFIEKKVDLSTAIKNILLATRHYAKRQTTWFKHQMPNAVFFENKEELMNVITK